MNVSIPILAMLGILFASPAFAQDFLRQGPQQNFVVRPQPNILQQPTVSPYLGLLRQGGRGSIGLNYYSIVRPEFQMRDTMMQQQQEQERLAHETRLLQQQQQRMMLDPATQAGANPITGASRTIRPTGHATSHLNLQGRFGAGR